MIPGILSLLAANFIGGALSPIFVKLGVREIPPVTFTAFRFIIASLVILPVYLKHPDLKITKNNFKPLLINSIFFTVNVALFSIGIQYTTVVFSQVLYAFVPILVAILAHFLLQEKVTKYQVIGSIIAFAGLLFLLLQSLNGQQNSFGTPLGNLVIIVAVMSWAAYFVLSRKVTHYCSQISLSFANFFITAILLFLLIPIELAVRPFSVASISSVGVLSLLGVGIFSSVIYLNFLQAGIRRTSAFIASLFIYTGPLFAAMTAIPLLGEKITLNLMIGAFLILFGVFYATTYGKLRQRYG